MSSDIANDEMLESDDDFLSKLGQLSQRHRTNLGITAAQLSELSNLSLTQVNLFERGKWDIDLLSLGSLLRSLNTTAHALFDEVESTVKRNLK